MATCASPPCAAALLGDVALTTVSGTDPYTGAEFLPGENVYGPFEAGFDGSNAMQKAIMSGLGCPETLPSGAALDSLVLNEGVDTKTAEAVLAAACGIELPRVDTDLGGAETFTGLVDSCGGHTAEYHFHERLSCLYDESPVDESLTGHSAEVGETTVADAGGALQKVYGKWEDFSAGLYPVLDACGGHFGPTPDAPGASTYHYHVQFEAPFVVGCYGPSLASPGGLVTVEECESLYDGCATDAPLSLTTAAGTVAYRQWCPCWITDYNAAAPATEPTPMPVPSPTGAPTASEGSCEGGASTVEVVRRLAGKSGTVGGGGLVAVPLAALVPGDTVLGRDLRGRRQLATVAAVPRSPTRAEGLIEITMAPHSRAPRAQAGGEEAGAGGEEGEAGEEGARLSLTVTPHHTFPSCDPGGRGHVSGEKLAAGSCLFTVAGARRVASVRRLSAAEVGGTADAETFTVVLERGGTVVDIAVGGVFTHVKAPGTEAAVAVAATVTKGAKLAKGVASALRNHNARHHRPGATPGLRGNDGK